MANDNNENLRIIPAEEENIAHEIKGIEERTEEQKQKDNEFAEKHEAEKPAPGPHQNPTNEDTPSPEQTKKTLELITEVNFYKILGVESDATQAQLKKAYKDLMLKNHPDKNLEDKDIAEKNTRLINNVYNFLSDPTKRAHYDNYVNAKTQSNNYAQNTAEPGSNHSQQQSFNQRPAYSTYKTQDGDTVFEHDTTGGYSNTQGSAKTTGRSPFTDQTHNQETNLGDTSQFSPFGKIPKPKPGQRFKEEFPELFIKQPERQERSMIKIIIDFMMILLQAIQNDPNSINVNRLDKFLEILNSGQKSDQQFLDEPSPPSKSPPLTTR